MRFSIGLIFCFISILSINSSLTAQSKHVAPKPAASGWTTNNPFHTDVFVENKGQFNNWVEHELPILYAVNNSDKIFFTKQGVIFRLQKIDTISEEEREQQEQNVDKDAEEEK